MISNVRVSDKQVILTTEAFFEVAIAISSVCSVSYLISANAFVSRHVYFNRNFVEVYIYGIHH